MQYIRLIAVLAELEGQVAFPLYEVEQLLGLIFYFFRVKNLHLCLPNVRPLNGPVVVFQIV